MRSDSLAAVGRREEAIADHDRVFELLPFLPKVFVRRARLLKPERDPDGVIRDCDRALAIDPSLHESFSLRGIAHACRRRYDREVGDFTEAARLNPTSRMGVFDPGVARVSAVDCLGA